MYDTITKINGTLIQHGTFNNRVYIMKLADSRVSETIQEIEKLIKENEYTKVIGKIPIWARSTFEKMGYKVEASIPNFYHGSEDVFFMAKYFLSERKVEQNPEAVQEVLDAARAKEGQGVTSEIKPPFEFTGADLSDAQEIADVYRQVFESYPFPIHEVDYIRKTMEENVVYFCIRENGKIVSVASSEMDIKGENVEMTDFATLQEYRGNSFAVFLLEKMEEAMRERGVKTAYTIARALSYGMNITFSRLGYSYGGTLTNNTDICGELESMNVWYKPLLAMERSVSGREREETVART